MRLLGMYLRRLRSEPLAAFAFVLILAVTAFAAAAGPRLLDRTADEALRAEIMAAGAGTPDVELIEEGRIERGRQLDEVAARGEDHQTSIPPAVRSLVADRYFAVDTPFWAVLTPTPEASTIFLRIQEGVEAHIAFTEGRPPTDAVNTSSFPETDPDAPIVVLEAALAATAADTLGVGIGDTIVLARDATDPLADAVVEPIAVEIVGTFEAIDPAEAYWSGDTHVGDSWIRSVSNDVQFRAAIAIISPEAYPSLLEATTAGDPPLRYRWRHLIDPARIDADAAGQLTAELRRMEGLFPASATTSPIQGTLMRSGLLGLIELQQARWQSAEAILAVVATGVAAVAAAALGLIAVLTTERRRPTIATWIARGATSAQLAAATTGEIALLSVPAVALATLVAVVLIATDDPGGIALAVAVGIATLAFVVASVVRMAGSRMTERGARLPRRPGARRLVVEAVVVILAVGGAVILRQRGVSAASSTGEVQVADPLIAAVPALAGLAAGLGAARLVSIPIRGLAAVAARRRDLVPLMGLRRATREGTTAAVLIVLMLTAIISSFSLAAFAHVSAASEATAWHEVGAPFRLSSPGGVLPGRIDANRLPGVEAAADAYRTTVAARGVRGFDLLAIDLPRYQSVVAGTPLDDPLPEALLEDAPGSLPAIVSTAFAGDVRGGLQVGDRFGAPIRGATVQLRVVAIRDSFPTMPVDGRFAVISLAQLEALDPSSPPPTSSILLRAPDDGGPAIRRALGPGGSAIQLDGRAEQSASFRASPVIAAVLSALVATMVVTAAYAALAVATSLTMAASARVAEAAHLRALGLARRQAMGLVLAEHGSTIVIGFVAGTLLGVWLFAVLQPGLGLSALIGSNLSVPIGINASHVVVVGAVILIIAAVGIGLSAAFERASAPAFNVRRGIE